MAGLTIETKSADETEAVAGRLAKLLCKGDLVALAGGLGAGKTVFVRGMARGLGFGPDELVTSPTFVILHEHQGPVPLYHFDFYRLRDEAEVLNLGFEEYFDGDGVCAVEWADKFPGLFGDSALWVRLSRTGEDGRKIEFEPGPGLAGRWPGMARAITELNG